MKLLQRQNTGAFFWVLSIQYYIVQISVALAWHAIPQYSWAKNTISDLGNTNCGAYGSRLVCSPLHPLMNVSFLVLGLTMIYGAFFLRKSVEKSRTASTGFCCMAVAGIGTILVGLFPENTVSIMHILGAALPFTLGNLSMILIGVSMKKLWVPMRTYTVFSGLLGLVALIFFMTHHYAGLGIGGMERLVSYPQSIWMIIFGGYILVKKQALVK
jgi:hypothetical membrane protein